MKEQLQARYAELTSQYDNKNKESLMELQNLEEYLDQSTGNWNINSWKRKKI